MQGSIFCHRGSPGALCPTCKGRLKKSHLMIFSGRPFSTCSTCLRINSKANGLVDHGLQWTQTDIEPLMGEAYQPSPDPVGPQPCRAGGRLARKLWAPGPRGAVALAGGADGGAVGLPSQRVRCFMFGFLAKLPRGHRGRAGGCRGRRERAPGPKSRVEGSRDRAEPSHPQTINVEECFFFRTTTCNFM